MSAELITVTINGVKQKIHGGSLLIKAAEEAGTYIPRFCWHPRMTPVGMCRMCLVEVEGPRGTMLVTSCTTPVSAEMVVHTESDTVKKAQEGILEFLLANHPLDCPVCDRGGECPLQDQTMSYGPGESRFVEEKRHYEKPIPISDLVMLDRERCILCARCTRFSDEISGDPLIEFMDRGNGTQVNTFPDEPFASYFSGNTVQICPVGALTATPYRFRARPWDLRVIASTCVVCTAGDAISVHASQNEVLRYLGVDNDATNHGWLSDKCRFGFEYLNSDERLTMPLVRGKDGTLGEASWSEALNLAAEKLGAIIDEHGAQAVAGLGGARGTNEDAYAFAKFMRSVIGSGHLDAQMDDGLNPQFLAALSGRGQIGDLERAKTILLWAPDLKEEHPTLYLRVRRAAQELGAKLIVVHPRRTGLDDRAAHKFTYKPGDGAAVLEALMAGEGEFAKARAALNDGPVVAIVGRPGLTESPVLAESVAAFARDLPGGSVLPIVRRSNTYGALDMGVAPNLLPGRAGIGSAGLANLEEAWGGLPTKAGYDAAAIATGVSEGSIKAVILLGADPVVDMPNSIDLAAADLVIAIDLFLTDSSTQADIVLPAVGFAEKEGTVTNLEGRVQKVNKVVAEPGQAREDWSILDDLAARMGKPMGLASAEAIAKEIAHVAPAYDGVTWDLVTWDQPDGAVVPVGAERAPLEYVPVVAPRNGPVSGEGFVLHSARTMYDDGVICRQGQSIGKLAPGAAAHLSPADARTLDVVNGSLLKVSAGSEEAELPVVIDDSLAVGVVYVPFNQPGGPHFGSNPEILVVKV
ncbi:MAG: NADH-quinone oxidoreductase subunit NuoG [Acidimicrobiia bacterium]|nr:NADH-quinone oxidoreductase subunit NuoG [Acidimicrobiia bacterium]